MIKRIRVYICNHCGVVDRETRYFFFGDTWRGPPEGWTKLGDEDLCPICSEAYSKFKREIVKESK